VVAVPKWLAVKSFRLRNAILDPAEAFLNSFRLRNAILDPAEALPEPKGDAEKG